MHSNVIFAPVSLMRRSASKTDHFREFLTHDRYIDYHGIVGGLLDISQNGVAPVEAFPPNLSFALHREKREK